MLQQQYLRRTIACTLAGTLLGLKGCAAGSGSASPRHDNDKW